jgi:hypothetical protein
MRGKCCQVQGTRIRGGDASGMVRFLRRMLMSQSRDLTHRQVMVIAILLFAVYTTLFAVVPNEFIDSRELNKQVSGESRYRRCEVAVHLSE